MSLRKESGLEADFEIIGNLRQIRKDDEGNIREDGVFYVCFTDKVSGELITKSLEGEYFWVDINKVSEIENLFKPSVEIIVNEVKKWAKRKIYLRIGAGTRGVLDV